MKRTPKAGACGAPLKIMSSRIPTRVPQVPGGSVFDEALLRPLRGTIHVPPPAAPPAADRVSEHWRLRVAWPGRCAGSDEAPLLACGRLGARSVALEGAARSFAAAQWAGIMGWWAGK